MDKFKINFELKYSEPYLPTKRHRKPRYRDAVKNISLSVRVLTPDEAPVAFLLSDYSHTDDNKTVVRYHKGQFFTKMNQWDIRYCENKKNAVAIPVGREYCEELIRRCLYYRIPDEDELPRVHLRLRAEAKRFILIDDELWQETGEPRYVVNTFGLGHNHGGTGLFVVNYYNNNIPNRNYFSALDGDKAVQYANTVAARRDDTDDVGRFSKMIEVLMPETVRIKPMRQHGKGNPFMNSLNEITEHAGSTFEAGILAIAATSAEIN